MLNIADQRSITLDTESFNIMLRRAAKIHDLWQFDFIKAVMGSKACTPDAGTYRAFLSALTNPVEQSHVLKLMWHKGMLENKRDRANVLEVIVGAEFERWLNGGKEFDRFLSHMDSTYGTWLTTSGANKLIAVLGRQGPEAIHHSDYILRLMLARGVKPDMVTFNTMLSQQEAHAELERVVRSFVRFSCMEGFRPDKHTYRVLFNAAWKAKAWATARVIWQYACLEKMANSHMIRRVKQTLETRYVGRQGLDAEMGQRQVAGKSPANDLYVMPPLVDLFPNETRTPSLAVTTPSGAQGADAPPTAESPLAIRLVPASEGLISPARNSRLIKSAIGRCMRLFLSYTPSQPLPDLLQNAYEVDAEFAVRRRFVLGQSKAVGDKVDEIQRAQQGLGRRDMAKLMKWRERKAPVVPLRRGEVVTDLHRYPGATVVRRPVTRVGYALKGEEKKLKAKIEGEEHGEEKDKVEKRHRGSAQIRPKMSLRKIRGVRIRSIPSVPPGNRKSFPTKRSDWTSDSIPSPPSSTLSPTPANKEPNNPLRS
jgi:hypothetical protein